MHLCRGNNRGSWFGEGDYAPIAEKIFNAIDVDGFLLEFDGDRSGGFEPLRFMPRDKTVVLGLVTTKTGPRRRSTTCCAVQESHQPPIRLRHLFEGNPLSWEQQRRKLELVVETARRAWG